jgi:hypothetical protein
MKQIVQDSALFENGHEVKFKLKLLKTIRNIKNAYILERNGLIHGA